MAVSEPFLEVTHGKVLQAESDNHSGMHNETGSEEERVLQGQEKNLAHFN